MENKITLRSEAEVVHLVNDIPISEKNSLSMLEEQKKLFKSFAYALRAAKIEAAKIDPETHTFSFDHENFAKAKGKAIRMGLLPEP